MRWITETAAALLLVMTGAATAAAAAEAPALRRERLLLVKPKRISRAAQPGTRLRLRLFEDASFVARAETIERDPSGTLVWRGRLEGVAGGAALLVVEEGAVAGAILLPEATYQVRPSGGGLHRIREIDGSWPADWGDDGVVPAPEVVEVSSRGPIRSQEWRGKTATDLDLVAFFTRAAARQNGGRKGMRALIRLQVELSNQILEASRARARLRLVGMRRVNYRESDSMARDLSRLKVEGDQHLEVAHRVRDRLGADFVTLYTHHPGESLCGRAYLAWGPLFVASGADPSASSFSIVRQDCPDWVLVHEVGHNMGLNHARDDYGDPHQRDEKGAYPFSYGYKDPLHGFFTVMSNSCTGCRRLLRFSNPRERVEGQRIGAGRRRADSADNVRSINLSRRGLAELRPCKLDCGGM